MKGESITGAKGEQGPPGPPGKITGHQGCVTTVLLILSPYVTLFAFFFLQAKTFF